MIYFVLSGLVFRSHPSLPRIIAFLYRKVKKKSPRLLEAVLGTLPLWTFEPVCCLRPAGSSPFPRSGWLGFGPGFFGVRPVSQLTVYTPAITEIFSLGWARFRVGMDIELHGFLRSRFPWWRWVGGISGWRGLLKSFSHTWLWTLCPVPGGSISSLAADEP